MPARCAATLIPPASTLALTMQVQSGLCASTSVEPLSRVQLWDVSAAAQGNRPGGWRLLRSIGDGDMMFVNR